MPLGWFIYLFAVLWAAGLMFTAVFFVSTPSLYSLLDSSSLLQHGVRTHPQVIMFSDLETDYINPIDFCNKMNKVRYWHARDVLQFVYLVD